MCKGQRAQEYYANDYNFCPGLFFFKKERPEVLESAKLVSRPKEQSWPPSVNEIREKLVMQIPTTCKETNTKEHSTHT
jgi:hypothetical protein